MNKLRRPLAIFLCAHFLFLIGTSFVHAQIPAPSVGCINTSGFVQPELGTQGSSPNPPVNLNLGFGTELRFGFNNADGLAGDGGGSIIDSSINSNAADGCSIEAGQLVLGASPRSTGGFSVAGPTSRLLLNGPFNRLDIGLVGQGSLTVTQGGVVDASINPAPCVGEFCNNFVSNIAGSFGQLTIDGSGSRVDTINAFVVGAAAVFDPESVGLNSIGQVFITNGGVLNTQYGSISEGPGGSMPSGTEATHAIVSVRGAGSRWNIEQSFNVANHPIATADIEVCDGGEINIGGALEVYPGATVKGSASINGFIDNQGGEVSAGCSIGTLTIDGDLNFASGTIVVEADGPDNFDIINVSGNANIDDATIRFVFGNGYAPAAGDVLPFVQAGSLTGTLNYSVETENVLSGFEFDVAGGQFIAINDGVVASVLPQMDIRPGTGSNKIYPRFGLIPVGILTTDDQPMFDATAIKDRSVRFGPKGATAIGRRGIRIDLDHDGDRDVLYFFSARRSGIACGDSSATLTAKTKAGTRLTATDAIKTIGCR